MSTTQTLTNDSDSLITLGQDEFGESVSNTLTLESSDYENSKVVTILNYCGPDVEEIINNKANLCLNVYGNLGNTTIYTGDSISNIVNDRRGNFGLLTIFSDENSNNTIEGGAYTKLYVGGLCDVTLGRQIDSMNNTLDIENSINNSSETSEECITNITLVGRSCTKNIIYNNSNSYVCINAYGDASMEFVGGNSKIHLNQNGNASVYSLGSTEIFCGISNFNFTTTSSTNDLIHAGNGVMYVDFSHAITDAVETYIGQTKNGSGELTLIAGSSTTNVTLVSEKSAILTAGIGFFNLTAYNKGGFTADISKSTKANITLGYGLGNSYIEGFKSQLDNAEINCVLSYSFYDGNLIAKLQNNSTITFYQTASLTNIKINMVTTNVKEFIGSSSSLKLGLNSDGEFISEYLNLINVGVRYGAEYSTISNVASSETSEIIDNRHAGANLTVYSNSGSTTIYTGNTNTIIWNNSKNGDGNLIVYSSYGAHNNIMSGSSTLLYVGGQTLLTMGSESCAIDSNLTIDEDSEDSSDAVTDITVVGDVDFINRITDNTLSYVCINISEKTNLFFNGRNDEINIIQTGADLHIEGGEKNNITTENGDAISSNMFLFLKYNSIDYTNIFDLSGGNSINVGSNDIAFMYVNNDNIYNSNNSYVFISGNNNYINVSCGDDIIINGDNITTIGGKQSSIYITKGSTVKISGGQNNIYEEIGSTVTIDPDFSGENYIMEVDSSPITASSKIISVDDNDSIKQNVTNEKYANIMGYTIPNSYILLSFDNNGIIGKYSTTSDLNGYWEIDSVWSGANGTHAVTATITTPDSITQVYKTSITTDYQDGFQPITSLDTDKYILPHAGYSNNMVGLATNSSPSLHGIAEDGCSVVLRLYSVTAYGEDPTSNVVAIATATADASGFWSTDFSDIPDGIYVVKQTATDGNGVSETGTDLWIAVDTASVATPIVNTIKSSAFDAENDSYINIVSTDTPYLEGTAVGASVISVFSDGKILATARVDDNGNWELNTPVLSSGIHELEINSFDKNGISSSVPQTLLIDIQPVIETPTITSISSEEELSENSLVLNGTGAAGSTVVITDSFTDRVTGENKITNISVVVNSDGTWDLPVNWSGQDGLHSLSASLVNENYSTENNTPFNVVYDGSDGSGDNYDITSIDMAEDYYDGDASVNLYLNGGSNVSGTQPSSTVKLTYSPVEISAAYVAGNNDNAGDLVTIITKGLDASNNNYIGVQLANEERANDRSYASPTYDQRDVNILSVTQNGESLSDAESLRFGWTDYISLVSNQNEDVGIHVAGNERDKVYLGGFGGLDGIEDADNLSQLRATGDVGFYTGEEIADNILSNNSYAYLKGSFSTPNVDESGSSIEDTSNNSVELISSSTLELNLFPVGQSVAYLTSELSYLNNNGVYPSSIFENNVFLPGARQDDFDLTVDLAWQYGVKTVAPIVDPDIGNGHDDFLTDSYYDEIKADAIYGGALAIDSPAGYFMLQNDAYKNFIVDEIKWGVSEGLQVSLIISPWYAVQYGYDVREMVSFLEATGAVPTEWDLEDFNTQNQYVEIGSDTDPNSEAGVALWLEQYALQSAVQYAVPVLSSASLQNDTLTLNLSEDAFSGDYLIAGLDTTTTPWFSDPSNWNPNAAFQLYVDGQAVGGIQLVSALHSDGESEAFNYSGNFSSGNHSIEIKFLNADSNASGGRNLYVEGASLNGQDLSINSTELSSDGACSFNVGSSNSSTSVSNTRTPTLAGYSTARSYIQIVDDSKIISTTQANANGYWSVTLPDQSIGEHVYKVESTSSEVIGQGTLTSDDNDTSKYVDVSILSNSISTSLMNDSSITTFSAPTAPIITSAYNDDISISLYETGAPSGAEFEAYVDGLATGSIQTITATNDAESQTFNFAGNFSTDTMHTLELKFLNGDGGTSGSNANLIVADAFFDGTSLLSSDMLIDQGGGKVLSFAGKIDTVNDFLNTATPTFAGRATANSTVTFNEGNTILGSTQALNDGSWTFTVPSEHALNAGNHVISVVDSTPSGMISEASSVALSIMS